MARDWSSTDDPELERQFVELEGVERPESTFAADAVLYDDERHRVVVEFKNGCLFAFPPGLAQGLSAASPAELHEGRVLVGGETLRWIGSTWTCPLTACFGSSSERKRG